ncbi:hypothetical protein ARMSODRAFT_1085607 [Armillaria solidipes]|uniref:Uncharacterized protein n=1 Tax=Armillaria solidipes TaxID=1076256 RepID=A0A2H3BAM6_9AGAR|nr:hypothetical protein ARMSODRAFT_1085607 [Armillaria solidipes]
MSSESTEVLQSLFQGVEGKLQSMLQARRTQVQEGKSRAGKKGRGKTAKMDEALEQEKSKRDALIVALRRQYTACPEKSQRELEECLAENNELLKKLKNTGPPK